MVVLPPRRTNKADHKGHKLLEHSTTSVGLFSASLILTHVRNET